MTAGLRQAAQTLARDLGAEDRIHFLGSLDGARIEADLLRAGDGFVQTSLYEGQSNAILEAMHEGLPSSAATFPPSARRFATAMAAASPPWSRWTTSKAGAPRSCAYRCDGWTVTEKQRAHMRAATSHRFALRRMVEGFETTVMEAEGLKRMLVGRGPGRRKRGFYILTRPPVRLQSRTDRMFVPQRSQLWVRDPFSLFLHMVGWNSDMDEREIFH